MGFLSFCIRAGEIEEMASVSPRQVEMRIFGAGGHFFAGTFVG